jgi:ribosomal protein S25
LVVADYSDIGQRRNYELALSEELSDYGIRVYKSLELFPPLKEYDTSDYSRMQQKLGYQAILFLEPNGTATSNHSEAYRNWYGGVSSDSYENLDGVYTIATLTDAQTGEHVYKASITTTLISESNVVSANKIRSSCANKLAKDLSDNGFLKKVSTKRNNKLL